MTARQELPVLACVLFDLLGFGMIISDLQLRAQSLTPSGLPVGGIIGAIFATTFIIQTAVSPFWGRAADRVGRKPVLVVCTAFSAAAMFIYGAGHDLAFIFVSRLVAGFGGANVAIAQAYTGDIEAGSARTAALGRIGAAVSLGLIVGPVLGGFLVHDAGYRVMAFYAAGLSFLGIVWVAIAVPRDHPKPAPPSETTSRAKVSLLRDLPAVRPYAIIAVVAWFSLATLEGTFARLIQRLFGYDQRQFGILFSYEALLGFLVQALLLNAILKWFRETPLLRSSYLLQGLGLIMNPAAALLRPFLPPMVTLFIASTGLALGGGVANPTVNGICSRMVPENRQGELFGLLQSARSVGFVIGPIIGGVLFDWWPPAPYILAGVVCVAAAVLVPNAEPAAA